MDVKIRRLHGGRPLLLPEQSWEADSMANSCALFLERSKENDALIETIAGREALDAPASKDGFIVSLYTGCGKDGVDTVSRQYRGLAIFAADFTLIRRLNRPVLRPSDDPNDIDARGIEDVRLTRTGKTFYAWYCGFNGKRGAACAAYSDDLLRWTKVAPLPGNINATDNKDHVIFEGKIMGRWWMLHRPWGPAFTNASEFVIRLASSDDILGPWNDGGQIISAYDNPQRKVSWVGAGPAPIPLGRDRFLLIYHTGSYFTDDYRQYDACAALLDFTLFTPGKPDAIVVKRLEPLMVPETTWEKNQDLRIDIVFPVGAFIQKGDLVMSYGAGDKHTCAVSMPIADVLRALERSERENPETAT